MPMPMKMKHNRALPPKPGGFKKGTTLEEMLQVKSFDELLKDGDILDVKGAAAKTGYSYKHLQWLCREDRVPHVRRGVTPEEVQFFFFSWQIRGVFEYRNKTTRA
jgi:hypothetical protein